MESTPRTNHAATDAELYAENVRERADVWQLFLDAQARGETRLDTDRQVAATANRCYCPDDCNCRTPWRTNHCGCTHHADA